jgi:UDP-glucose:(heptosyl)LPS alpha-1,3-glucosyltransferase
MSTERQPTRMRIGLVYRHFNLTGSIPRCHVELARGLVARGHEVHVFACAETRDESISFPVYFHAVPTVDARATGWSARQLTSFAVNAARLVRTYDLDIVHNRMPGTWLADITHFGGITLGEERRTGLSKAHLLVSRTRRPALWFRRLLEHCTIRNDRVVRFHVDSRMVAHDLMHYYNVTSSRISVVPPGVNHLDFAPSTQAKDSLAKKLSLPHGFKVVFTGHDFARKGLDRAIESVAAMRQKATLLIIGNGDRSPYMRLARRRGIAEKVLFLGSRSDVPRILQAADVAILPTRVDMWGAPAVEAMATGIPIIVSAAAGSAEAVVDGQTGHILSDPFDRQACADLLDRLATSDSLRTALGKAGRERAMNYTWEVQTSVVEKELRELASLRAAHRHAS